jgi:hypothetical protein
LCRRYINVKINQIYSQGASMSLHHIAKNLENRGRGKDSVLVHMTPREVGGLQALAKAHGGSLTRNPETGLYEAGFLEQVLPIVAMAAATYFTAGAAAPMLMSAGMGATSAGILAGAGAGALISGGSAAIQGGDVGKAALTGAVVGGIGGGIGAPGDVPVDPNAALAASTEVGTSAINIDPSGGGAIDPLTGTTNAPAGGTGPGSGNVPQGQMPQLGPNAQVPQPGIDSLPSSVPNQPQLTADQITNLKSTQTDLLDRLAADKGVLPEGDYRLPTQTPGSPNTPLNAGKTANQLAGDKILQEQAAAVKAAQADPGSSWWSKQTPVEKAAYTTAGAGILAGMNPNQTMPVEDTSDDGDYLKRISPNFRAQEPIRPNPYYRGQYPTYAAEGGIMMGAGGIADLGSYSDGGRLLKGPGDGVSDNIPATIGGHQPARLADGEFVVPARIVSELGNGSTDAGAKRLYAMMERVQAKRKKSMGKGKFAVNAKAAKELPV